MFGANYAQDFGAANVAVSAGYGIFTEGGTSDNEPEAYSLGIVVGFSGFSFGASYAESDESADAVTLKATILVLLIRLVRSASA